MHITVCRILIITSIIVVNALALINISIGNITRAVYGSRAVETGTEISTDFWIKPRVAVNYPNGGEELTKGDIITIKWKAESSDRNAEIKISIKASFDDGESYAEEIATNIENSGSYEWKLDRVAGDVRIKVSAIDTNNLSNTDESKSFSINKKDDDKEDKDDKESDDKDVDATAIEVPLEPLLLEQALPDTQQGISSDDLGIGGTVSGEASVSADETLQEEADNLGQESEIIAGDESQEVQNESEEEILSEEDASISKEQDSENSGSARDSEEDDGNLVDE